MFLKKLTKFKFTNKIIDHIAIDIHPGFGVPVEESTVLGLIVIVWLVQLPVGVA